MSINKLSIFLASSAFMDNVLGRRESKKGKLWRKMTKIPCLKSREQQWLPLPLHVTPVPCQTWKEKEKKGGLRRVYFADVTLHALRMIKSVSFSKLQTAPSRCSLSEIKVQGWPGACGRKHLFRIRCDWSHSICAPLIVLWRPWRGSGWAAQLKAASV